MAGLWEDFNRCMDEVLRASDPPRSAPVSADGEHLRHIRPETLLKRASDMTAEESTAFQSVYERLKLANLSVRSVALKNEPVLRLLQDGTLADTLFEVLSMYMQHAEQLNTYIEDAKLFREQKPGASADDLLAYFNAKGLK